MEESDIVDSANRTPTAEYGDPQETPAGIVEFENGAVEFKVEDMSPSENTPQKHAPSRRNTSLGFLTRKFIEKLSRSVDGVLDIKEISQELRVSKRRIYDVTNVLEGIQLIKKKSKSHIQWLGRNLNDGKNSQQFMAPTEEENKLDELIRSCAREIRKLCEERHMHRYAYLTHADICRIQSFKEQTLIVIKAPAETKVMVPHPDESLQIHIRSINGPIEVFLCPDSVEFTDNTAADGSQLNSTTCGNDSLTVPFQSCPQESSRKDANSSCEMNGFSHHNPS